MIYSYKRFFTAKTAGIKRPFLLIFAVFFMLLLAGNSAARDYSWVPGDEHRSVNNFEERRFLPAPKESALQNALPPAIEKNVTRPPNNSAIAAKNRQIAQLKKKLSQENEQSGHEIKQLQLEVRRLNAELESHQAKEKKLLSSLFPSSVWPVSGLINSNGLFSTTLALISPLSGALKSTTLPAHNSRPDTPGVLHPSVPLSEELKPDYAAGVLIGRNIMQMKKRNNALNIKTNNQVVLTGIQDFLEHRSQLSEEEVNQLLFTMGSTLQEATDVFSSRQQLAGTTYVEKFIKRPGTHRAPAGFYYKIELKSRGEIAPTDNIDIRIKESLIDGTVVSDSSRNGAVISQPLNAYPPLFQDAIQLAGKKGAITLVVPPELAYGEEGNPPLIPPGATMVYYLEVVDART